MRNFKCYICEITYDIDEDWTDEKENQELLNTFGIDKNHPDMIRVCDDCYKKINPINNLEKVEESKKYLLEKNNDI